MKHKIMQLIQRTPIEIDSLASNGLISQQVRESWYRVWDWSAPRMGGTIGIKHDAFYKRWGKAAYYRKINKTRAAFGIPPYPTE